MHGNLYSHGNLHIQSEVLFIGKSSVLSIGLYNFLLSLVFFRFPVIDAIVFKYIALDFMCFFILGLSLFNNSWKFSGIISEYWFSSFSILFWKTCQIYVEMYYSTHYGLISFSSFPSLKHIFAVILRMYSVFQLTNRVI